MKKAPWRSQRAGDGLSPTAAPDARLLGSWWLCPYRDRDALHRPQTAAPRLYRAWRVSLYQKQGQRLLCIDFCSFQFTVVMKLLTILLLLVSLAASVVDVPRIRGYIARRTVIACRPIRWRSQPTTPCPFSGEAASLLPITRADRRAAVPAEFRRPTTCARLVCWTQYMGSAHNTELDIVVRMDHGGVRGGCWSLALAGVGISAVWFSRRAVV
jgi:hypothetical protein